jgi:arylsulfatase A-like enzyme
VDRAQFWRAVAVTLPLTLAMLAIKLVKLPTSRTQGLFERDLLPFATSMFGDAVTHSTLAPFLAGIVLVLLVVRSVAPARRTLALIVASTVLYLLLLVESGPQDLPIPLSTAWFAQSLAELRLFGALYWRELLVSVVVFVATIGVLRLSDRHACRARLVALILLVLLALVLGIDAGYFAATRAEISSDEFRYLLQSPFDSATAARDGWNPEVGLLFALPFAALAISLVWWRRLCHPRPTTDSTQSVGLWLWPALALLVLAPAAVPDQRMDRLSGNVLFRLGEDFFERPIRALLAGPTAVAATSSRVPDVTVRAGRLLAGDAAPHYNVVLVLLESIRADATTLYSPTLATTPFLSRLAADSLVVDTLYANVPRTSAAWIATLTGRYPGPVSVLRRWAEQPNTTVFDTSLATQLRSLGYATGFFTTTRLDFENDTALVHALGFEHIVSRESLDAPGFRPINSFGVEDRAMLPSLRGWLDEQASAKRPFLLTLMTNAGHFPYTPPPNWLKRDYSQQSRIDGNYLNCVAYIDAFLQDVVGELEQRQLLDDTVLVILGDHGEAFGEHGLIWHTAVVYEEGLHVPALVRLPANLRRTGRVNGLRQQIDVLPTVLDALGLDLQGWQLPGRSLLEDAAGHPALFFSTHFDDAALALRDGQRKYIYRFGRRPIEVYDLENDPLEQHDLAGTTSMAELLGAEADMRAWYGRVKNAYLGKVRD